MDVPQQRLVELEQRILAASVRAEKCCAAHDADGEWLAECDWQKLVTERDELLHPPAQRGPSDV